MRRDIDFTRRVRDIQTAIDEFKAVQAVGNGQIVVKEYISNQISITSTGDEWTQEAYAKCSVSSSKIGANNVLITHCVAEVRLNGVLIDGSDPSRFVYMRTKDTGDNATNAYGATAFHSSLEGETISSETYTVKFHVWAAGEVTVTASPGEL